RHRGGGRQLPDAGGDPAAGRRDRQQLQPAGGHSPDDHGNACRSQGASRPAGNRQSTRAAGAGQAQGRAETESPGSAEEHLQVEPGAPGSPKKRGSSSSSAAGTIRPGRISFDTLSDVGKGVPDSSVMFAVAAIAGIGEDP